MEKAAMAKSANRLMRWLNDYSFAGNRLEKVSLRPIAKTNSCKLSFALPNSEQNRITEYSLVLDCRGEKQDIHKTINTFLANQARVKLLVSQYRGL
jgi:hypothetical protein